MLFTKKILTMRTLLLTLATTSSRPSTSYIIQNLLTTTKRTTRQPLTTTTSSSSSSSLLLSTIKQQKKTSITSRTISIGGRRHRATITTTTRLLSSSSSTSSCSDTSNNTPPPPSSSSSSSQIETTTKPTPPNDKQQQQQQQQPKKNKTTNKKKTTNRRGKDKRREFIGMAKAVDRGQFPHTYNPGGDDGRSFVAHSGLPSALLLLQEEEDDDDDDGDETKKGDDERLFTVLGIESSCDDTGVAIVRSDGIILSESLSSQHSLHASYGGIVPSLARQAHLDCIDSVLSSALQKANMTLDDVDAIGVTVGPGLELCLRVGCHKARELALTYDKPFVGVHHLEAHILMARMTSHRDNNNNNNNSPLEFPFLALLVSGGHCQILHCRQIGSYAVLGGTIDDSLGEAYDKIARLLNLPTASAGGGGPAIEALALSGNPHALPLPIPLSNRPKDDLDFSYAGLKTSVRMQAMALAKERGLEDIGLLSPEDKADVAASFQHVAIRHVEQRLERAMAVIEEQKDDNVVMERCLAVVGGVAANQELRRRLQNLCDKLGWRMVVPPPRLCTDQGTMAAWAAIERLKVGSSDDPRGQDVYARFPFANRKNEEEEEYGMVKE